MKVLLPLLLMVLTDSAMAQVSSQVRAVPVPKKRSVEEIREGDNVSACNQYFWNEPESATLCIKWAKATRWREDRSFEMCKKAFNRKREVAQCLEVGAASAESLEMTVLACAEAFSSVDNRLLCLNFALTSRNDISGIVAACHQSRRNSEKTFECLNEVVRYGRAPPKLAADTVRACHRAMYDENDFFLCLHHMLSKGPLAPRWIASCDYQARTDSETLSCLEQMP